MSELRDQLASVEAEITKLRGDLLVPLYEERDQLLKQLAEVEDYELPRPSLRTETQQKIARCPRCKDRITL